MPASTTVTFDADANPPVADLSTMCIDIPIIDDDDYEGDNQQFTVIFDALSVSPTLAIATGTATVTIADDNFGNT